jgi:hypothetical protein
MFKKQIKVNGDDLPEGSVAMFCPGCRYLMMPKELSHNYYCPNIDCWLDHVEIFTRKSDSRGIYPISKWELNRLIENQGVIET